MITSPIPLVAVSRSKSQLQSYHVNRPLNTLMVPLLKVQRVVLLSFVTFKLININYTFKVNLN